MSITPAKQIREALCFVVQQLRRQYFKRLWGMHIGHGTRIACSARLDKMNPQGVHIGSHSLVAFGAAIVTHDWVNGWNRDVRIGDNCFIGAHAIVLPGVEIGDNCIIAAGSLVVRNVPAGSLVTGNPARVVENNVKTARYGVRLRGPAIAPATAQEATACCCGKCPRAKALVAQAA
ncbi:MAG TPA: acyltransferase [Verrucomicrobiae bacterium]|nr:acyltransferase [Verrucomicrobiae bacterium]